ncbi:MFS transporter [Sporosarcina sp. P21c]|uniref:MFS transporter n=1 Tax=Sporosarcina TaxID=1569 RepID=UPI000A14FA96|nr:MULTISPECIES: MFS transporter [Sporosarcina]ARJ39896.1 multidrug transporter [Sporosarcina ureae]PIC66536.1 MFS transporter [Sporosarcina sp. P16a]PIC84321.1 MFS transporter [Sporosarcina sp. P1]PIC89972.1 MFS transporter [Sporosarcina sp. P21c]PIC93166.1 MFS transporter [Sporosarcina sp. P25]
MNKLSTQIALYILMFNMFIAMAGVGLIIPIMPEFLGTFGVAGRALGLLIAMFSFAQFIFSPIAGNLSDKYGRKSIIVFGLIIYGFSQLAFSLSTELWMLYLARFFSGFGAAFIIPPTMAFVADITSPKNRGRGMGLLGASMSLGFMIGPGIGGFLSNISLYFPFYFAAAASMVAAVVSLLLLPNPKPVLQGAATNENIFQQMRRSTQTSYFVMLIVMFVFSFGLANFQSTISLYVDQKYNYTPSQIAVIITVGGFVGVIIQTFVIDRLFKRFGEMRVILINLVIAAFAMLGILFVNTFFTILLVATIFSTATSLLRPAVNTLVSKLAGKEQGYAAGMMNAYMSLGNMIGPATAGYIFDMNMESPYIVGTIILLLCFILALYWARNNKSLIESARTS